MNLSDIFGEMPHRPDNPDFWRLSSIILRLDGLIDSQPDEDAKEEAYEGNLARWIDHQDALVYMAFQRAARAANAPTVADVRKQMGTITRMMALYAEAFQVGAEFVSGRDTDRSLDDLRETGLRLLLTHYEQHVQQAHEKGEKPLTVAEFSETEFGGQP